MVKVGFEWLIMVRAFGHGLDVMDCPRICRAEQIVKRHVEWQQKQ